MIMAYDSNFYNDFDSTFQEYVPPPPVPPPPMLPPLPPPTVIPPPTAFPHAVFPPPIIKQSNPDQDFLHKFEPKTALVVKKKPNLSIHKVRNHLRSLVCVLNSIKEKEKTLTAKIDKIGDLEWISILDDIEFNKKKIHEIITNINTLNVDVMRKLLVKRAAKRARLKRLREERKREKEEWIKEREERSRKIDEKLQKIKDDIKKAKQEEADKIQADIVLRETLRKKNDAKKCVIKLDALVKLRRALQNTAKGRGENVNENEAVVFESNIEKLKTLWSQKLSQYEQEETNLRLKLKQDLQNTNLTSMEKEVTENVGSWKNMLFGGGTPQFDFHGDVRSFVSIRSEWDQYVNEEGTSIPIGWVVPSDCYQL